jgi:predicted kinase
MQGLSGSGKTTVAQSLLERLGGVRVRSDVERKRLHGLEPEARAGRAVGEGLYAASASEATYGRLAGLARQSLDAGYPIVVDATFLRREDRNRFRRLAAEAGAPFAIAHCVAPADALRARVAQRALHGADASDATLAVLESQVRNAEPLADDESRAAVTFEGEDRAKAIDALLERLGR